MGEQGGGEQRAGEQGAGEHVSGEHVSGSRRAGAGEQGAGEQEQTSREQVSMSRRARAGDLGNRKHVRQRVVQNAGYAVDINIRFGVLGHVGMGLTSWCLSMDGWSYPSRAGSGSR